MLTPRQLGRWILGIVAAVGVLLAILYGGDYLSLRFRIPNRQPFGTVRVRRYYAVTLKNKNTEFMFDDPQDETCVNSIAPHYGFTPCWYLSRHKQQRIDVNAGAPGPLINTF